MLTIEQALKASDLSVLRSEINLREEEIRFNHCNQQLNQKLHHEISQIRAKVYQIISLKTKGKVSYTMMPGLA